MQKAHETRHCPINAVIFDMDNTLFDFVEAKLIACAAVIAYLKVPVRTGCVAQIFPTAHSWVREPRKYP